MLRVYYSQTFKGKKKNPICRTKRIFLVKAEVFSAFI